MDHTEKQPENDNALPLQEREALLPEDAMLMRIRARFGLDSNYLPNDTSLPALLAEIDHPDWRVRTAVVRRLGSAGEGEEVRDALIYALGDVVPAVRAAAARALGDLDDQIPETPLLEVLCNDVDADVRTAAAQTLSRSGERLSPSAVSQLEIAFHRKNEDDVVRASLIYVLGGLWPRTSLELLRSAMKDEQWLVREAAALMMGEQGERTDEEALQERIRTDDEHPMVVQAASDALEAFRLYQEERLAESEARVQVITYSPAASLIAPAYKLPQCVGNVAFDGIQPGFINIEQRIPIISQAPDNQWVPGFLLKALFAGRVHLEAVQGYLMGLVRTEYLRSLINGEQIIMNRAFLYNNSVIARDYVQNGPSREVFKQFLSQGVIIPFLLYERSPDEMPQFTTLSTFSAWKQVCEETHMQCMRFSWLDEQTNDVEVKRFGTGLHRLAQSNQVLNIAQLVRDLGIPGEQEPLLRKLLSDLHKWSSEFFEETGRHIKREDIYKRYITSGDPARRQYDASKPFAAEIKQLFDVAYNNNLAQALGGYLLTPVDSPTSLILQDWHFRVGQERDFTTLELVQMMREKIFQVVQSGLYLRSIGMLRLQDVLAIRNTDEWRIYIDSLQKLLRAPLDFANLANHVYQNYISLARVITRLMESRDALLGSSLLAEWRPDVKLVINVGGSEMIVVWPFGENIPFTDANEQKANLPQVMGGIAPVNVRMIIGDSGSPSKLHTSIDIIQGRMQAAQVQWLDLCDRLCKQLRLREFSSGSKEAEKVATLSNAK